MTDIEDLPGGPVREMDDDERALADELYAAIMRYSATTERSLQASNFQAGISDLGFCSERLRRMLRQEVPEDSDLLPAFIGTALGKDMEAAIGAAWSDAILQSEVVVTLDGSLRTYNVTGHPDVISPLRGLLLDGKTSRGLGIPRRTGPSQSQQFQRHCYAKGAHEAGLFGDLPLSEVRVGNFWLDRAADERELHVDLEFYDEDVVRAATEWLDEVVYNFTHQQEAPKEPPREMCEKVCGFFADCRMYDTDVEGLLGEEASVAVRLYHDGIALQRDGKRMADQAKAALRGVQGMTGEFAVRWTHVNGGPVSFLRNGYERLDIKRIK